MDKNIEPQWTGGTWKKDEQGEALFKWGERRGSNDSSQNSATPIAKRSEKQSHAYEKTAEDPQTHKNCIEGGNGRREHAKRSSSQ